MTSEEIKEDNHHDDADTFHVVAICDWLKEIAYQLAVMNEHKEIELRRESERMNRRRRAAPGRNSQPR